MRNLVLKITSTILIFILSMLAFCSCSLRNNYTSNNDDFDLGGNYGDWDFYPEGYTGGFPRFLDQPGFRGEYWWVETYEECVAAVELLKSHGSTFEKNVIFSYDGELFDTKYLFEICIDQSIYTEQIKFGDDPFDRRADYVQIKSYAFAQSVTIDEINYGNVNDYEHDNISLIRNKTYENNDICFETIRYEFNEYSNGFYIYNPSKTELYFSMSDFNYSDNPEKAVECLEAVLNSIVWINKNGFGGNYEK